VFSIVFCGFLGFRIIDKCLIENPVSLTQPVRTKNLNLDINKLANKILTDLDSAKRDSGALKKASKIDSERISR
jgi:hypothetical protein